jgi:hypothetical protein
VKADAVILALELVRALMMSAAVRSASSVPVKALRPMSCRQLKPPSVSKWPTRTGRPSAPSRNIGPCLSEGFPPTVRATWSGMIRYTASVGAQVMAR